MSNFRGGASKMSAPTSLPTGQKVAFSSEISVILVDSMGDDLRVAQAAWVSTKGERAADEKDMVRVAGLINYLMRHRHGTPFEAGVMQFLVKAPIFVFREWHRHRIASYNEYSARYSKMLPLFYIPPSDRPLVQGGTSAHPKLEPGTAEQTKLAQSEIKENSLACWARYERLLEEGIAKEVARDVLPVNIYSSMYCTMNLRSIMNFMSLRTHREDAAFVSNPLWEIEMGANEVEASFTEKFPLVHQAFGSNGRVAP